MKTTDVKPQLTPLWVENLISTTNITSVHDGLSQSPKQQPSGDPPDSNGKVLLLILKSRFCIGKLKYWCRWGGKRTLTPITVLGKNISHIRTFIMTSIHLKTEKILLFNASEVFSLFEKLLWLFICIYLFIRVFAFIWLESPSWQQSETIERNTKYNNLGCQKQKTL